MHEINRSTRLRTVKHFSNYLFAGVIILCLTILIVLAAKGYDIDTSTGKVIQNGIILAESHPNGATAYIDDQLEPKRTPARFPLPQGPYELRLEKDGYKKWQSNVKVYGSTVTWLYYPLLVPETIESRVVDDADGLSFVAESPDDKVLLVGYKDDVRSLRLYRLDADTPEPQGIALRSALFETVKGRAVGSLANKSWSDDGRFVLLRYTFSSGSDYIVIDTENPDKSFRVGDEFSGAVDGIAFSGEQENTLLLLSGGNLRSLDATNPASSSLVAADVTHFATTEQTTWLAVDGGDSLDIRNTDNVNRTYFSTSLEVKKLVASRYEDEDALSIVYADSAQVYRFFEDKPEAEIKPEYIATLDSPNAKIQFAPDGRFLASFDSSNMSIYDLDTRLKHAMPVGLDDDIFWLDSHRVGYNQGGQLYISDFTGENKYQIASYEADYRAFINSDKSAIYTITGNSVGNGISLRLSDISLE